MLASHLLSTYLLTYLPHPAPGVGTWPSVRSCTSLLMLYSLHWLTLLTLLHSTSYFLLTHSLTYLPTYLLTYLLTYLPTYLPTYLGDADDLTSLLMLYTLLHHWLTHWLTLTLLHSLYFTYLPTHSLTSHHLILTSHLRSYLLLTSSYLRLLTYWRT